MARLDTTNVPLPNLPGPSEAPLGFEGTTAARIKGYDFQGNPLTHGDSAPVFTGGSGRTASERAAVFNANQADRRKFLLIQQSLGKNAAIVQQFGSRDAWILAGSPPYKFGNQIFSGSNTKGLGGTGSPVPNGWIVPSPGNTNPNGYDIESNLASLEAEGRDTSAARRGENVRTHKAETDAFYRDNPDRTPPGYKFGAPGSPDQGRNQRFKVGPNPRLETTPPPVPIPGPQPVDRRDNSFRVAPPPVPIPGPQPVDTGRIIPNDPRPVDNGRVIPPTQPGIIDNGRVVPFEGQQPQAFDGTSVGGVSDATATQTVVDRAAPFQQNRAAVQGQEGARTPNRRNDFTYEQQRRQQQQRSQSNSFSGNRRFRSAQGA